MHHIAHFGHGGGIGGLIVIAGIIALIVFISRTRE